MGTSTERELRELIERLAGIERESASPGEREAAELIAAELRAAGADAVVEEERVHGTYWWPIGLLTGLAALAGLARRRFVGTAAAAFAAVAVADDVRHERRWFRRAFLPKRSTWNVTGSIGPPDAARTLVFVAHHDAAHTGIVFHPEIPRALPRRWPRLIENANTTFPTLWGAFFGPVLVALGSLLRLGAGRRLGTFLCAGYLAAMVDIGRRGVVPGANDNLTGVAVLVALARALGGEPPTGLRVLLVSTGSEESFSEGMQAWGERHFPELPPESTDFICVDTLGSPRLLLLEGEGMLGMHEYPKDLLALLHRLAREHGIDVVENLRFRNATDGIIPLLAGYRTAMMGSVDEFKAPTHYHWPSDTPENVDYGTLMDAVRLCELAIRELAPAPEPAALRA